MARFVGGCACGRCSIERGTKCCAGRGVGRGPDGGDRFGMHHRFTPSGAGDERSTNPGEEPAGTD